MKVAVVIPCYRVRKHILGVISQVGAEVDCIYVVDDCCPENSGEWVQKESSDPRVQVLFHEKNQGVGGAMITGYRAALADGMEIVVKLDGDGQMSPDLLPQFIEPIQKGLADYTKGNRFFHPHYLASMPKIRIFGNTLLSFLNKLISGYWDIMDPTNGYTAIHHTALRLLDLDKINKRYFFESDLLFRLNVARAVVMDVPMLSVYADEESNLRIQRILFSFPQQYAVRLAKRILFNYFLRDFNLGSLALVFGSALILFGTTFGLFHWIGGGTPRPVATAGTVMVAALPVIMGFQLLLAFLQFDVLSMPKKPISQSLLPSHSPKVPQPKR